jgi:hypothetical protein
MLKKTGIDYFYLFIYVVTVILMRIVQKYFPLLYKVVMHYENFSCL